MATQERVGGFREQIELANWIAGGVPETSILVLTSPRLCVKSITSSEPTVTRTPDLTSVANPSLDALI
jgi:hypothetical protein